MKKLNMHTKNIIDDNIRRIGELFPNALTERKNEKGETELAIDFDVLKQELFKDVVEGREERYQFTWPDKKKSMLLANASISDTLRPCREESINFDTTENLYIEGDNLNVLKLLQETYLGKVKMIYIDPPYNTGNDFVYNDSFFESADAFYQNSLQYDNDGQRLVENLDSSGRFHTDWLNMLYPRIKIAKDLLCSEGVLFVSIDDNEIDNAIKMCDEIFGRTNRLGIFVINSTPNARDYGHIGKMHEFTLFYAKNADETVTNLLPEIGKDFKYSDEKGSYNIHPLYNSNESFTKMNRPNLYYPFYLYLEDELDQSFFRIGLEKRENAIEIYPPKSEKNSVQFVWRWGKEKAHQNLNKEIIGYKNNKGEYRIVQKMRHDEKIIRSLLTDTKYSSRRGTAEVEDIFKNKCFSFPKPLSLLLDFAKVGLRENEIVMDFFSGSATTAHAVMQLNAEDGGKRKFIMVQLPELIDEKSEAFKAGYKNICEIGKERIRRAGSKIKEEFEQTNRQVRLDEEPKQVPDIGFRVLKLDSSNMKDVYYSPEEYTQLDLSSLTDNIKEDRTPEDLLFQVMLELGVLLSSPIEASTIAGKQVFRVADNFLIACFDKDITNETVTAIAKLKPYYAVFRDSSYANDAVAVNFEQIFAAYSPDTVRRVL